MSKEELKEEFERVVEPEIGSEVYFKDGDNLTLVKITNGEFWNYKYGRLSNFWYWTNLETGKEEYGYGNFYIIKKGE